MSTTKTFKLTILFFAILNGCSRDYAPDAKSNGEEIKLPAANVINRMKTTDLKKLSAYVLELSHIE